MSLVNILFQMETLDILKLHPLFCDLAENELVKLGNVTRVKHFIKKDFIVRQGDPGYDMYLIKSGLVDIKLSDALGNQVILTSLMSGDLFGELSILDGKSRVADAVAKENCELIVFHKSDFLNLIQDNSKFALQVIKYLCERIRFTDIFVHDLATKDVYNRMRNFFYQNAKDDSDGKLTVPFQLTHEEIAARLGCDRVMVSRLISELVKGDYLSIDKKIITINKKLPHAR